MKPGSYRYFAQEWKEFMRLCDTPDTSADDLDAAMKALVHLSTYTEESCEGSDTTLETTMLAASYAYQRACFARVMEERVT